MQLLKNIWNKKQQRTAQIASAATLAAPLEAEEDTYSNGAPADNDSEEAPSREDGYEFGSYAFSGQDDLPEKQYC